MNLGRSAHFAGPLSRRQALKLALAGGAALALPLGNAYATHRDETSSGDSPAFSPYSKLLPIAPVLAPVRSDSTTDYYEVSMDVRKVEILPGYSTEIWGYNGQFPGPTIETRSGRKVVVRQTNNLPVNTSIHTHGAYVDGDSDGHPSDLIAPDASKTYYFGNDQLGRTQWYHDHAEHFTATNVYRGLSGFYLIRDDFEDSLPLPKGPHDVPLIIQDRVFNSDGSLKYPDNAVSDTGLEGDVIVVNGAAQPRFEVANRRYRFRILNGSNARPYELKLSTGQPFQLIATEGGLLEKPLTLTSLPIWPGERYEIVVDFSKASMGSKVVLQNGLGDGKTSAIMRFDVVRSETDESSVPDVLRPTDQQVDATRLPPGPVAVTRTFKLDKTRDGIYTINGKIWNKDRIDADPRTGDTEIWELDNGWGWSHPVHIHLINFEILDRNGNPPEPHERGWKETVVLHPSDKVRVKMRWPEVPLGPNPGKFLYRYAFHCHNLEHEDHDMMAQIEVLREGSTTSTTSDTDSGHSR